MSLDLLICHFISRFTTRTLVVADAAATESKAVVANVNAEPTALSNNSQVDVENYWVTQRPGQGTTFSRVSEQEELRLKAKAEEALRTKQAMDRLALEHPIARVAEPEPFVEAALTITGDHDPNTPDWMLALQ